MRARQVNTEEAKCQAYCYHYLRQSKQRGGTIPYFKGSEHQYGSGIGGVLSGIGRTILPSLAPVALDGATSLIGNTIGGLEAGQNFGDALVGALAPTGKMLLGSTIAAARARVTKGKRTRKQSGRGLAIPGKKSHRKRVYKGKKGTGQTKKKPRKRKATKRKRKRTITKRIPLFSQAKTNF